MSIEQPTSNLNLPDSHDEVEDTIKKPKTFIDKTKNLFRGAVAATMLTGAVGYAQENNNLDQAESKVGTEAIQFKLLPENERTAIYLSEYHEYMEKGTPPKDHRTDLQKKFGQSKSNWDELTLARAKEIAIIRGFDIDNNSEITLISNGYVPTDIRVNGEVVPFFENDYSLEELNNIGSVKKSLNMSNSDERIIPDNIESKTVVSPDANQFFSK